MQKSKVVIFDHEGGWVLINPEKSEYETLPHVVNPDLSLVKNLPPESWALVAGKVVPRTDETPVPRKPIQWTKILPWAIATFSVIAEVLHRLM